MNVQFFHISWLLIKVCGLNMQASLFERVLYLPLGHIERLQLNSILKLQRCHSKNDLPGISLLFWEIRFVSGKLCSHTRKAASIKGPAVLPRCHVLRYSPPTAHITSSCLSVLLMAELRHSSWCAFHSQCVLARSLVAFLVAATETPAPREENKERGIVILKKSEY